MKKISKKILAALLVSAVSCSIFAGCTPAETTTAPDAQPSQAASPATPTAAPAAEAPAASSFNTASEISVVSREDGSGTRGAFIELFGVEVKGEDGTKKDMTTKEATIANKTDVMLSTVANNPYAVGYVSIGSLSSSVKAVPIEGVIPTSANVKNGSYIISRPFNIAVGGAASDLAADFISFIMSAEGQSVVSGGYVAIDESAAAYSGSKPSGKLVVAGSSSVSPVMEQLIEAYNAINASATIELQTSDSTAGMTAAIEGNCDIGMASRALTDAELETLTATEIAIDGIALIVNNENTISDISKEQVKSIFTGETTEWSAVIN